MQSHVPTTTPLCPLSGAARTLTTVAPYLPTEASIHDVVDQAKKAAERGYFLPDEDERVRSVFAHYLTIRAALMTTLRELEPFTRDQMRRKGPLQFQAFTIAFCTACMLVRSGRFVVDSFEEFPVIWRKLDEAEPRFGIPRKQFSTIFKSLTSLRNVSAFQKAIRYAQAHRQELLTSQ